MLRDLRRFIRQVYSTVTYRLTARSNPQRYVDDAKRPPHWDRQGLTVKIADADDFDQLTRTISKFQHSNRLAERTSRGDVCVMAYKQSALAHFRWIALTSLPLPELDSTTLHLKPDEVYTYDSYTLPAFRRQGIAFASRTFLMTHFSQRGIRTFYSLGRYDNRLTQEHQVFREQHGGTGTIGTIRVRTLLGTKQYRFTGETQADGEQMTQLFRLHPSQVHVRPASELA